MESIWTEEALKQEEKIIKIIKLRKADSCPIRWDEDLIRQEIMILDSLTGLKGGDLPVVFCNHSSHYAQYWQKPEKFEFSNLCFQMRSWPIEESLDTIKHEFAHYMVNSMYPDLKEKIHGQTWKECCRMIGARQRATLPGTYRSSSYIYGLNALKKEWHNRVFPNDRI